MKKSILSLGTILSKAEQQEIKGSIDLVPWVPHDNCFQITNSRTCGNTRGCNWYNSCYCGPLSPHIAPC
ncbi:hypothetical protein T190611E02C_30032 [Tenacibaculum sp. 190524A05c]|uniref:hypothetical protein n=1 Tax=Tenacibaculum platacis TaxID=3137852 RepID=UPI0031FB5AAC